MATAETRSEPYEETRQTDRQTERYIATKTQYIALVGGPPKPYRPIKIIIM